MNGYLMLLGFLLLVAGVFLAANSPIDLSGVTFYPNFWPGAIIGVVGFMTVVLGIAYEKKSKEEVEEEILREVYGEETPRRERTVFQEEMTEDPVKILKLRLAKGEISKEEYEELRKRMED